MSFYLFESYDPSEVDDFRSLKGKSGHIERGLFIAESPKIVRKILGSSLAIESAFLTPEYFSEFREAFEAHVGESKIFLAPIAVMEKIVGYNLHQGVMLAVKIPKRRSLKEAVRTWPEPFLVIALDGIADAENMGAIIRNAAAFGANAILVDDQSCSPYLRRSVRVSMGTIVDVEVIPVSNLAKALQEIDPIGPIRYLSIIGASLGEGSVDLTEVSAEGNIIIVFGSEGWGLRKEVMEACDVLARIPISESVDSLNVAIASGIFLYYFRQ
jgi:tRNA G18 (ribose-2'-O)-methylase SpoU